MNRTKVLLLSSLAMWAVMVLSSLSYGQGPAGGWSDLTEEQKAQIAEIRKAGWTEIQSVLTKEQQAQLQEMRGPGMESKADVQQNRGKGMGPKARSQEMKGKGRGSQSQAGKQKGEKKGKSEGLKNRRHARGDDGRGYGFMRGLSKLDLTEDQKAQIDQIHQTAWEQVMDAETREEKQAVFQKLHEDIQSVLTDEQREQLQQMKSDKKGLGPQGSFRGRRGPGMGPMVGPGGGRGFGMMAMFDELDLTEEQKTQIEQLHQDARDQAAGVDNPEEKRMIFQELRKNVQSVLTEEQQEQLRETMRERMGPRGSFQGMKGRGMGPMAGPGRGQNLDKLDLTEEQQANIAEIRKEMREKIRAIRQQEKLD